MSDSKEQKYLTKLRSVLTKPEFRGRVLKKRELYRAMDISKQTFSTFIDDVTLSQEWFRVNQGAPIDAKAHYKALLEAGMEKLDPAKKIIVEGPNDKKPIEIFVSKKQAQEKAKAIATSTGRRRAVKEVKTEITNVISITNEKDGLIDKIREAFVMADAGELPTLRGIMEDFGLLDTDGKPQRNLTVEEVRQKMIAENWKAQRSEYLTQTLEIVPEEVKFVSLIRNLEMQKNLFNLGKLRARQEIQFMNTGKVRTLDGNMELPNFQSDLGTLASVAEVMRRMVDGGGNINVLINNFNGQVASGAAGSGFSTLNQMARKYLSTLSEMPRDDFLKKLGELEKLKGLLTEQPQRITIEDIKEAQAVEVVQEPPKKAQD